MSANPFNIWDEVQGDFVVEKEVTKIECDILGVNLEWRSMDIDEEVLTLDDILDQVIKAIPNQVDHIGKIPYINRIPFIRVTYESGLWGAIFEVGNYKEKGRIWIVHGVTKGYA